MMRLGSIRIADLQLVSWASIVWEPAEDVIEPRRTISHGRRRRPCLLCAGCEAYVIGPAAMEAPRRRRMGWRRL